MGAIDENGKAPARYAELLTPVPGNEADAARRFAQTRSAIREVTLHILERDGRLAPGSDTHGSAELHAAHDLRTALCTVIAELKIKEAIRAGRRDVSIYRPEQEAALRDAARTFAVERGWDPDVAALVADELMAAGRTHQARLVQQHGLLPVLPERDAPPSP